METVAAPGISWLHYALPRLKKIALPKQCCGPPSWTSTSLHCIFLTSSVCVRVCLCVCGFLNSIPQQAVLYGSSHHRALYVFLCTEVSFLIIGIISYHCPHILLQRSTPTIPMFYILSFPRPTTPLSKVLLSSILCDFNGTSTVQMHPLPFVM